MASLRPVAAAQQLPPHVGQHVGDSSNSFVRLLLPARGIGAASRLPMPILPFLDAGEQRVISGIDVTGLSLHPGSPRSRS
jgi:hypothetical protein